MLLLRTGLLASLMLSVLGSVAAQDKHALLVGINDYQHVRHLRGSVNDITRVRQILVSDLAFSQDNIRVLLNEEATKRNILAALSSLADRTKAGDALFLYYSGHGFMMQDQDGDEAVLDGDDHYDEVVVPYDAVPWPRERATDPNSTMLSDDEVGQALSGLSGRRVVIVFDSCHSGSATRTVGDTDSRSLYPGFVPPGTPKTRSLMRTQETMDFNGSLVFLSAASPLQSASDLGEFEGQRHGAFTASLLRTIKKSGPGWHKAMSWDGLFRAAREDLLNQGFASQTPSIRAAGGLNKRRIDEFFEPAVAAEIADLDSSERTFEVQLESKKYRFVDGELLELAVESERDGYLYIFDINAEQKITQLFPNHLSPENRIRAGQLRMIPDRRDRYQFRAGPPYGQSVVVAVVTEGPWAEADQLNLPDNFRPLGENQKSQLRDQLRLLHDAAGSGDVRKAWASQKVVLQIVSLDAPPEESAEFEAPDQGFSAEAVVPQSQESSAAPPAVLPAVTPDPPAVSAAAAVPPALVIDDSNLSEEDQADLPNRRPELFRKLEQLAERYSPVFWQDVGKSQKDEFRPWKDFIVRYDFDITPNGPNWPIPPQFQDEVKRQRVHSLDDVLGSDSQFDTKLPEQGAGVFDVQDRRSEARFSLDLRPYVYWAVLTTSSHYFLHYVVYHAEDWKGLFGHAGDLEGTTIVVDRKSEKMVAAFTLAHDDVDVVRSLDEDPGPNIGILVDPASEARGLFEENDDRPIDGSLSMDVGRGASGPKEHQDIYIESKGHGQHGPKKIKESRYVIYANYLDDSSFTAPSFEPARYPVTKSFAEVQSKHKYGLIYVGSKPQLQQTMWGEYGLLSRFSGGANPPWNWRDNWLFKTGWWKDPRRIKKIGDGRYLINPYIEAKKRK